MTNENTAENSGQSAPEAKQWEAGPPPYPQSSQQHFQPNQPPAGYQQPPAGYQQPYYPQPAYQQPPMGYYQQPMPQGFPQQQQQQQQVVMVNGVGVDNRKVSHGMHLLLTILTAGLWLPVWIILAVKNS